MADKKVDKEPSEEPTPTTDVAADPTAPKRSSGLLTIIKAIGFVSVIVIVEVVAASMLIPSAQETAKLAQQYVAAGEGDAALVDEQETEERSGGDHGEEVEEVEMGQFNVTHFNPATNSTLSIDFELFGAVLAEDAAEFHELFEKNKVRIREQVILTLHGADSKDLSDAGLGLLKRQILEKTNRALGHPLLREVLFSKFNFIER